MITTLLRRRELKTFVRRLVRLLRLFAPTRSHVVVAGFPDTEGNAVEVVRGLLARGEPVHWLTDALSPEQAAEVLGAPSRHLSVLPKRSMAGFTSYLTARLTFFTHGLYTSPPPPRRKPVVNLWHGDGPKAPLRDPDNIRPLATALVSGARLFGEIKADFLAVPQDQLLVVGNPRWDQLRHPVTDHEMRRLGLDPSRPFLVHMPTFRSSRAVGSRAGWSDTPTSGGPSTAEHSTGALLAGLAAGAREAGAQVVVKPHPLDADAYDVPGAVVLTNDDLARADVVLYRLLGRAAALVTDYSSVWTDFLTLDRPIGFVLNDLADYEQGSRGLNVPNLLELLPGPQLLSPEDCEQFATDALSDPPHLKELRATSAELVGLASPGPSATDALFAELRARGLYRSTDLD